MWVDKLFSTVSYFDKPVLCTKHDSDQPRGRKGLKLSDEVVKQSEEIFCVLVYIRKCVMDPFYYNIPYPSTVSGKWFKQIEKLPWNSTLTPEQLEEEMGLVQLIHDIATYTLVALTKVCIYCESASLSVWVSNTKEDTDLWHSLKEDSVDFKEVMRSSQYQKILDDMYGHDLLTSKEYQFIDTIFSITFMIRYSVFSSESVESIISSNKIIIEHTKKFTLKFPIGEDQIDALVKLSESANFLKGNEKETFKTLVDLVTRSIKFLKMKKYKEAEIFSHAVVTLIPSWCEGYLCLAHAVYQGGGNPHYAHIYASQGQQNCYNKPCCSACKSSLPQLELWKKECGSPCEKEDENLFESEDEDDDDDEETSTSSTPTKKETDSCKPDDVPELTDPSSDESRYESQSDDSDTENKQQPNGEKNCSSNRIIITSQVKMQQSPVKKTPVLKEADIKVEKQPSPVKKTTVLKEADTKVEKQPSPVKKTPVLKEADTKVEKQPSPVKKDTSEQKNDAAEAKQLAPPAVKADVLEQSVTSKPEPCSPVKQPKNSTKKSEKAKSKKQQSSEAKQDVTYDPEIRLHFKKLLKEGSAALLDGCGLIAARTFNDALSDLKSNADCHKLQEYETVCLKYAYGTACCKSGTFEDLNKGLTTFNEILNNHRDVWFPVTHYGLGYAQLKLNKFKEALSHFEMLQSIVDKGIVYSVHCWPGTASAIEETKTETVKKLLSDVITKCRNPPPPAATCRYEKCVSKPDIYYSDPDFKGFTALQCQDRCILNYHPACWKALKDLLNRTDKDFLGQQCLTPDCDYIVMEIKFIGKDGNLEKHFEIDDPEKVKKQKKSRLEKKLVIKELKKRRRMESQSTQISECSEACDNIDDELGCESTSNASDIILNKGEENYETVQNGGGAKKVESNLSVNAKPFYVRKDSADSTKDNAKALYRLQKDAKEAECVTENLKANKPKEKKKTSKPTAVSLEAFRQQSQGFSLYDEYEARLRDLQQNANIEEDSQTHWSTICETENIPQFDPDRPFYIPEKLREDHVALEAVLQSYSATGRSDFSKFLKEKIYLHLEKFLGWYGPIRVDDPLLLEEVANLPASFQKVIEEAGSLRDFMQACMRFAFVGEHICVISDVLKAYSLKSKSYNGEGYSTDGDHLQECNELINDSLNGDDCQGKSDNKVHSQLNPHAIAYNPVSPVTSRGSISSENSSCSLENCQSDVGVKETDQESPTNPKKDVVSSFLSKLRSPSQSNGPSFGDPKIHESDEHVHKAVSDDEECGNSEDFQPRFLDHHKAFQLLVDDIEKLPEEKMFSVILEIIKFLLSNEYFVENVTLFNQSIKPLSFSLASKSTANKRLQAGGAEVVMVSKAVMKEDEEMQAVLESFQNLEKYRNNMKESKKILEQQLEHAMDTIAQLQNALSVTDKSTHKKLEEVKVLLEEEKKESKKKEKNWEKELKRHELNQSKANDLLRICREEIRSLKEQVTRKAMELKEIEELKKATELDLAHESQAKSDVEASLHAALQFHENEVSSSTKKLQNAQLEILNLKKKSVLEKINVATRNSELRLKEIQDGLPWITHQVYLDQMKSLETKIKEHICQLGKICTEFMRAADEQINELKKGKDLIDLNPLVEPVLSECPTLKAPSTVVQGTNNLALGSPIFQTPLIAQTPGSSSIQTAGQLYNPFLNNQKLSSYQGPRPHGAVGSLQGLSASAFQMQNMMNSSSLFDSTLYPSAPAGLPQKPAAGVQPNGPRTHVPPGLNVPAYPTSQVLSNSLSQSSSVFHMPQVTTQSSPVTQPMQTPFTFGFPQLQGKVATATSENSVAKSIAELATLNSTKKAEKESKSPSESETHSEKSVSRDSISESKSTTSNPASLDSFLPPAGKGNLANSSNPSPVPAKLLADKSSHSSSSLPIPTPVSEHPVVNKASASVNDLESTGVKLKQPVANAKQKKASGLSCSGTSSIASDCDTNALLELGYTVKETPEVAKANISQPSSSTDGFAKAQKKIAQAKNVPSTNSYDKLIGKLMLAYPHYARETLIECVVEFRRNHNNKLSNLKFGSIITGIGVMLEKRKSVLTQVMHKKKPQLQVISLTKKPAPPPPPPEKSGICPWAMPVETQSTSTPWNGDTADTVCSICLEDMATRSSVKTLDCKHRFHATCLKEWLDKNSNCPICRVHVLLPEDYPSLS